MRASQFGESRKRNQLILVLKRAIEASFSAGDWQEIGYATDCHDYVATHPRLLRSLSWGDDDYGSCVLDAVVHIVEQNPENLGILLEYGGIEQWIRGNEPTLHAEVFGLSSQIHTVVDDASVVVTTQDVVRHIDRIRKALDEDPAQAIGSTKELIETVLKTILGMRGARVGEEDIPKLLKRVQTALDIDPKDVDITATGGEALRRILSSLGQIVISVGELRNAYGTGHGRFDSPGLLPTEARLVVGAGTTVAAYLWELNQQLVGRVR